MHIQKTERVQSRGFAKWDLIEKVQGKLWNSTIGTRVRLLIHYWVCSRSTVDGTKFARLFPSLWISFPYDTVIIILSLTISCQEILIISIRQIHHPLVSDRYILQQSYKVCWQHHCPLFDNCSKLQKVVRWGSPYHFEERSQGIQISSKLDLVSRWHS